MHRLPAREGIVNDGGALDAGIIFGTGFAPFRGGPLHYAHARGSEALHKHLHGLEYKYGKRFHAREWLAEFRIEADL